MTVTNERRVDVAALKRDHPVAEVITGYGIELRRGGRALVGRCPFHADRGRPNLHVYPDSQRWYCYRCAIGGDVIAFVMRHENLQFSQACDWLAQQPRKPPNLPAPTPRPSAKREWWRLGLDEQVVMNTACAVYQHALWREPRALAYLRERGLPDWVIQSCALGYVDGHSLEAYLRRRSGLRIAQDLGLLATARRDDGGRPAREFLAKRIVVPELRGGQCVWFIGRRFDDGSKSAKYLALPGERPVLGVERAAGQREVVLCEGVFDYLTAVGWRLPACSPCGTTLPVARLRFLARAKVVYGVFDGDDAGRAAAERFGEEFGSRWRRLDLPDGCDLNELGQRPDGRVEFRHLLGAVRAQREEALDAR